MDSINHPLSSRLLCPAIRTKYLKNQCCKDIGEKDFLLIIDNSYYISDAEEDESSYSHQLLPLLGCNNRETIANIPFPIGEVAYCGACRSCTIGTTYYFCKECDKWYHKECVESPSMLKSPYHPKHSLMLHKWVSKHMASMRLGCLTCVTEPGCLIYQCSICNFSLDPICATKPPFINHNRTHEHTLYFLPRKFDLICDICGDDHNTLFFVCLQCDFFVHKWCIYLPHIIKICRHEHRLSFASSLMSQKWVCGVCRTNIDSNYGAYSCMKGDCMYVVHSRCATSKHVWDGRELEGQPEVNDSIKPPFEEMIDGIILHYSHLEHHLRLGYKDVKICNDEKIYCQACAQPIYDDKAYTCMEMRCDYALHEACAYLPRMITHALHAHSLSLEASCTQTMHFCNACKSEFFGFKYVCSNGCEDVTLDVRCASIYEPYSHSFHRHPLFITDTDRCLICGRCVSSLTCDECGFTLCFGCTTLPYKVRYMNDEHLLTFSYEKDTSGVYWCDLCERTINSSNGFYKCNECEVILHIGCLLGEDLYMNPGSRITLRGTEFSIVQNNAHVTRPICNGCQRRCQYRIMFLAFSGEIYCSVRDICIYHFKMNFRRSLHYLQMDID
ncbi:hypothetical protein N665_0241s0006 [Sinapis alba]|nr:hypothetical protein N665_0241s0006 [Sinapis alba]